MKKKKRKKERKPGMVAQAYNLSYLGSRDQEDHSLKPALEKS
jgi:hypothetical protein